MRSSSLATAPIVSSIGRQKRSAASILVGRPTKSKGPFRASQEEEKQEQEEGDEEEEEEEGGGEAWGQGNACA